MTRKKLVSKNAGGGAKDLPLRRSYEREALEVRGKHKDKNVVRPMDRMNTEEAMKLATKVKPDDYTIEQWRRACLIDLAESGEDRADRSKFLLPIRNPDGNLNLQLLADAEAALYAGKPKEASIEQRRAAAAKIMEITGGDRMGVTASVKEESIATALQLSGADGYDFAPETTEEEVKLSSAEPTVKEIEAYAKEHDMDFGFAARTMLSERKVDQLHMVNDEGQEVSEEKESPVAEQVRLTHSQQEQDITPEDLEEFAKEKNIPADGDAYRALVAERAGVSFTHPRG
jgi:hypothetical protein